MSEKPSIDYTEFDALLAVDGPVMIVGRQFLKPASFDEGTEIVFPPSYANPSEKKDDPAVYNIDVLDPADPSKNVCVLDSIPSQANRIEPIFSKPPYSELIPQYRVKLVDDAEPVNIANVGHRLADAVFRGTTIRDAIVLAFKAYAKGNATPLAKLGPTSLVFGVWDSRGTGVKVPRLINSIIRAFNVAQLKRSAQYSPPIKYEQEGLIPAGLDGKPADHGLADVPSSHKIGGVHVHGDIRRDFSLNLSLLRTLKGVDAAETQRLQRYVLGLSLIALTSNTESTLRQGCTLVPKRGIEWKQFKMNGEEIVWNPKSDIAALANAAASDFGIVQPENPLLVFDKNLLKTSIDADAKKKADKKAESKGDPIQNLKRLVADLEPVKGDKFSTSRNAKFTKLVEAVSAYEAGPALSDDLTSILDQLKPLLTFEIGAADRKAAMLSILTGALEMPPAGTTNDEASGTTPRSNQ